MENFSCKECEFHWKDDSEEYPCCHFESRTPWDIPPCELESELENNEEENNYD